MHLICPPKFCIKHIVFYFSWDGCNTQENWKTKIMKNFGRQLRCIMGMCKWRIAAWENSPHFATPPMISSRNDAWETSAEIPYWWRTVPTSVYSFWLVENLLHPIRSSTLKGVKPDVYENYCKCVCFLYFFSASDQYMILGSFPPTPSQSNILN